jgi:hypothetical protein
VADFLNPAAQSDSLLDMGDVQFTAGMSSIHSMSNIFLKEGAKIQKNERGFAWHWAFLKKLSFTGTFLGDKRPDDSIMVVCIYFSIIDCS